MKKANWITRLLKPLMNQRGVVGDQSEEETTPSDGLERDDQGFIKGTNYKTPQELIKGHSELKSRFDAQGNELGMTRKQAEQMALIAKEALNKGKESPAPAKGSDYETERTAIQDQIAKLDPMADDYQPKLASLLDKRDRLTASVVKEQVLGTAGELFKKELSERDQKAAQKEFLRNNPTFNTPEMQAKIKEYIANDETGMHDSMSAFFAIEKEDALMQAKTLSDQNAEMMKALELQKGKDSTGKVIIKGQSPGQVSSKPILTGKDRDAAMAEALAKLNGG